MLRQTIAAASVAALLAAPALAETKSYDVPAFTGIDVSSGLTVEFTEGSAQSVVAENEDGAWDKLVIEVKDDVLYVKRPRKMGGWGRNKQKFTVTVTAPQLSYLDTSSGSTVSGSGLSGDEVTIDTSSGSTVKVSGIDAGDLSIDTSSGSSVKLDGTCARVAIDTSSGSSVRAKDVVCQYATVDASSGSSVSISATQSVNADASSGSSVNVSGEPVNTEIEKSSGASVNIRG